MKPFELESLWADLARMPGILEDAARRLPEPAWGSSPAGSFCLVEHAWHLADLEREGYAERIRLLLAVADPFLPNFDGDRIARERDYKSKALLEGVAAFAAARSANRARLRSVEPGLWTRAGRQEGVGTVTLGDIPRLMLEHDTSHLVEIGALLAGVPDRTQSAWA
jgi:hypothetical protein